MLTFLNQGKGNQGTRSHQSTGPSQAHAERNALPVSTSAVAETESTSVATARIAPTVEERTALERESGVSAEP